MKIKAKYLDNNYYSISGKAAQYLLRKSTILKYRNGIEYDIVIGKYVYWLGKTVKYSKLLWCLTPGVNGVDCSDMTSINKEIYKSVQTTGYIPQ